MSTADSTLKTLDQETKRPPETRFENALSAQEFAQRLIRNDETGGRAQKRARCNGLVDGNPPYRRSALLKANRSQDCNVNWGVAKAYLDAAQGPFYDLFSEAPGFFEVESAFGDDLELQAEWSRTISEEANRVLDDSDAFDNLIQRSIAEMVQHGRGPLLFEDESRVFPASIHDGELYVPDFTPSDSAKWEAAVVLVPYYPTDLFDFIRNESTSTKRGWNVTYTRNVIANAMNRDQSRKQNWEYWQQALKNNSGAYRDDSKVCWVCHVFWKEFYGRITHAIVERDPNTPTDGSKPEPVEYLFFSQGRYSSFAECIHPMYYDKGNGGYHHSVTGLGVKMFAGMEFQNRLLCKMADDAFLPKVMFEPMTASNTQKFELTQMGSFGVLPAGFTQRQTGIAGMITDELALESKLSSVMQENLSSYRQQIRRKEGNPETAKQVMYEASQQSSLSKTSVNRFYKQLDGLYREMYRRMSIPGNSDPIAKDFQDGCKRRGVPADAISKVRRVRAVRVVGQGNNFMRQQAAAEAWTIYGPALPEEGRSRLLTDGIASSMGYLAATRYNPRRDVPTRADDQRAFAMLQVAGMMNGTPPVVTASQSPITYAVTFLQAAAQAAESVSKGGDPVKVLMFLQLCGPAIMAHLQRFGKDEASQAVLKNIKPQWEQLAKFADELQGKLEQEAQANQQQAQKTQQAMTDEEIKTLKAQNDIAIKTAKTQAQMQQSQEKHQMKMQQAAQGLVLSDAETAARINREQMAAKEKAKGEKGKEE